MIDCEFTAEELAWLEAEAGRAEEYRVAAGMRFESYQERRWIFAREWHLGSHYHTPSRERWVRRIKREHDDAVRKMRMADERPETGADKPHADRGVRRGALS